MIADDFNVLMVDDDIEDVFVIRRTLAHSDCQIKFDSFDCSLAFLKYLETVSDDLPDLLLIDINMPKLDGFQLLERLKADKHWSGIKKVVLSTSTTRLDRDKAIANGAINFFTKPTTLAELSNWRRDIERILQNTRALPGVS